ncbi:MAG: hypothetical protein V1668_00290 [Patescibacteria group bacterium]
MNKKIVIAAASLAVMALPFVASAVTVDAALGSTLSLGTADLEATVIKIIQWALGFLGLIAVVIILYGGFVWMTAAGNEEKVSTAKKVIGAAVVGLIVILLAWAIVTFVVNQSNKVVT